MRKLIWLAIVALVLSVAISKGQDKVPATMVSIPTTNASWTTIPTNIGTLNNVLLFLDTNLANSATAVATNYAPRAITGVDVSTLTPRWTGDITVIYGASVTNVQTWQSFGVSTSSWFMVYPVQALTTTNWQTFTNLIAPRYNGDMAFCWGPTSRVWVAFGGTSVTNWKATFNGVQ